MLRKIPKRFIDDHNERDLPAPVIVRETARHYYIEGDDPEIAELLSDARHYAKDVDGCEQGLIRAAVALIRALA